jgi:transcriptional regulator with XRE-family HTH domain
VTAGHLTIGQFVERECKSLGISFRQLAVLTGIPRTTLSRRLLDQEEPKPDELLRLAKVLEVNAADLFLLANVAMPSSPPSVEAVLRTEYDLPEEAIAEAKQRIDEIVRRIQRDN